MSNADQPPETAWRKSSYSGANQGECLEVADGLAVVPVRDSKRPDGPVLVFPRDAWAGFVRGVTRPGT